MIVAMFSRKKLTEDEIVQQLTELSGWTFVGGKLRREFATGSFVKGVQFVMKIGDIAENLNHHPDIVLTYPRVVVEILTHDVGGITEIDFELARRIDDEIL